MQKTKQIIFTIVLGFSVFIWCGLLITCIADIKNTGFIVSAIVMLIVTIILAIPLILLAFILGLHKNKKPHNENDYSSQNIKRKSYSTSSPNDEYEKYIARESNLEKKTISTQNSAHDENKPQKDEGINGNSSSPNSLETTHPIEKRIHELISENPSYTENELKEIILQEEKNKILSKILNENKINIVGSNKKPNSKFKTQDRKINLSYTKVRKLVSDFVVLDFETTGLSHIANEIIQIAAVRYVNFEEKEKFVTFVKPTVPIPSRITKITGISDEVVKDAPTITKTLPELIDFIKNDVIVAHNASFDMKFFLSNVYKENLTFKTYKVIDTLSLARKCINTTPNHKLPTLKEFLKLNELNSHDALHDCYVTAALYKYCYYENYITY